MIVISGHSDDIVSLSGDVDDEIEQEKVIVIGDKNRGVRVKLTYGLKNSGTWDATVGLYDENVPMFPVTIINGESTYTVQVVVMCPSKTSVQYV